MTMKIKMTLTGFLATLGVVLTLAHLTVANQTINYYFSNFKYRDFDFYHHDFPMPANQAPDQYFEQPLDHFDPSNTQTWKQRYWTNTQYFNGDGPVFIFIGGEGEERNGWLYGGEMAELSGRLKALAFVLEHRFYGKSRPTADASTENLKYLSKDQALADILSFRDSMHAAFNLTEKNKWVTFGGSYPGDLSAWMRLKHPDKIQAALASSAPIQLKIDFGDYLVVVNSALRTYNPTCPELIRQGMNKMLMMMQTSDGRNKIRKTFRVCEDLSDPKDVLVLYMSIQNAWKHVVQQQATSPSMGQFCDIMLDRTYRDPVSNLAKVLLWNVNDACLSSSYSGYVNEFKADDWNSVTSRAYIRNWFYQTCYEFGFFQTASSGDHPFGETLPVEFYSQFCRDVFGDSYSYENLVNTVEATNRDFGGQNFQGTNVLFINGDFDPWHALSYTAQPPNNQTDIILVHGTGHCADFKGTQKSNPRQLNQAIESAKQVIARYLK